MLTGVRNGIISPGLVHRAKGKEGGIWKQKMSLKIQPTVGRGQNGEKGKKKEGAS